jgi:hypothetical protein
LVPTERVELGAPRYCIPGLLRRAGDQLLEIRTREGTVASKTMDSVLREVEKIVLLITMWDEMREWWRLS